MSTLTTNGLAIIGRYNKYHAPEIHAWCDEPEKAAQIIMRAWAAQDGNHHTHSARLLREVEELPGFEWDNASDRCGEVTA